MVTPKTGWFSNGAFLSLSSMCREFIGFFYSHSTRYFPCRFSAIILRLSVASILGRPQRHLLFWWLPPSLRAARRGTRRQCFCGPPVSPRRDVHPLCLLLRCVAVATGRRDPQNCIEADPYEQLLTPDAVAGFHALRDQPSATAGAIVTAVRRAMTFTCVL